MNTFSQKPFSRNLREPTRNIKWRKGGSRASRTKTHGGHCCCNKKFQILPISDLHHLDDDPNENHNNIEFLFIPQSVHSCSSSHCLKSCFEQYLKSYKKSLFVLSLKLNFQGNWNLRLWKIQQDNPDNIWFRYCAQLWQSIALCLCRPKLRNGALTCLCALWDTCRMESFNNEFSDETFQL